MQKRFMAMAHANEKYKYSQSSNTNWKKSACNFSLLVSSCVVGSVGITVVSSTSGSSVGKGLKVKLK